ncbi:DUF6531 domain-containing protein [Microbulbifer spongiae]|uniref:DUF6531 domain-containing protein n=1 Tax=Microbulbifer spongiae TaxID=2944933 RepID=A0ABY9EDD9_9GAMM|nr:DUF6531 domain-containing protein [Microbulbifer sp. MI-G]WKD50011.1 DUF6531 domain-containing protein [Microbulbifer sp. MI-G]
MTPEYPAQFVSDLLKALNPPPVTFSQQDPAAACRWLNAIRDRSGSPGPAGRALSPWPEAPAVATNQYTIAMAPAVEHLPGIGDSPVHFINTPGVNPQGTSVPPLNQCRRIGGRVIGSNGEVAFERIDLAIPGPLPFHWKRYYRTSIREDLGIGTGWRHSLNEQLLVQDNLVELHTAEGRRIRFQQPAVGHACYNRFERLLLSRQSLHSYCLIAFDQSHKIFRADGVNRALPLSEIRDLCGNTLTIDYSAGLPRRIVSSWGRVVEFQIHGGRISKLVNHHAPGDQRDLCQYAFHGELLTEASSAQDSEQYRYKNLALIELSSDQAGTCQFEYDQRERCQKMRLNAAEIVLRWQHKHTTCQVEMPDRDPQQLCFNGFGQLTGERRGQHQRSWLYDTYGNLCQYTDRHGQRTFFRHDTFGRCTRRTQSGISTRYQYDQQGFPQAALLAEEQVWRYQFSDNGRPLTVTDPEKQMWKFLYGNRGQLTQITDPEGGKVDFTWDGQGQLQTVRCGKQQWGFEYDHWQRVTAIVADGETRCAWHYGAAGELREARIGLHHYTLGYAGHGQPCAIHLGNQQRLHWEFDGAGRVCQIHFADGNSWELQRNPHGQLAQLQTTNGCYHWRYDSLGQLVCHRAPGGRQLRWHYNPDGTLREYCDNDCHWYFLYNTRGAVTGIRNNNGQSSAFHYDTQLRLIQANNQHASVRFRYDRRGRVIAENHNSSDVRDFSLKYQYDSRGWLRSASSDDLDLTYTFAPCGSLYGIDANGASILRSETNGRDTILVQGAVRSTHRYRYGHLSTLESSQTPAWKFETHPPLPLTTPVRHAESVPACIDRDKRGNVIGEREMPARKNFRYHYDGWGLMGTAECSEFKTSFRYDPFGRRLSKTCTHRKSTRQRRVVTNWSGLGIWAETLQIDGKSRGLDHWIQHPLTRSILCQWKSTDSEHYLNSPDGRPLAIFDAKGAVRWLWTPGQRENTGCSHRQQPGPWRGINLIADSETDLWYHPLGYWHPVLQIWLNGPGVFTPCAADTTVSGPRVEVIAT